MKLPTYCTGRLIRPLVQEPGGLTVGARAYVQLGDLVTETRLHGPHAPVPALGVRGVQQRAQALPGHGGHRGHVKVGPGHEAIGHRVTAKTEHRGQRLSGPELC